MADGNAIPDVDRDRDRIGSVGLDEPANEAGIAECRCSQDNTGCATCQGGFD
jgi:hypothetical protein